MNIALLVEGHGETASAPILVRRLGDALGLSCVVRSVLRVPRSTIPKPGELERAVTLLGDKVGDGGAVLVLLDADDDPVCPLGPTLRSRAVAARPDRRIGVVLAVREYESWFLHAARSLAGRRGLPPDLVPPPNVELVRDAKRWLGDRMPRGYSPTNDQPAFTTVFDLDAARTSKSFDKLVREFTSLVAPPTAS